MRTQLLLRKVHYWLAAGAALPLFIIICTGLLLQFKKQVAWIQPPEQRGSSTEPAVPFHVILDRCRGVPQAGVQDWADVRRIDVRPGRGMLKVTAVNGWEVQLDAADGRVLQVAYRRSDAIEAMHDGSWLHSAVQTWLFIPAGAALMVLWLTGLYLFLLPILRRRHRRRHPGRSTNRS
jgi:uncharacterized iron-regulated membrane protein